MVSIGGSRRDKLALAGQHTRRYTWRAVVHDDELRPGGSNGLSVLRVVFGVVAGYGVIVAATLSGIAAAWAVVGAEGAFRPETTEASVLWSVASCILGLIASLAGGFVAALVGKQNSRLPETALAVLVLALGLAMAVVQLGSEPSPLPEGKTIGELTFFEAGDVASPPDWYNFSIPWIGAVGVMVGANFRRSPS